MKHGSFALLACMLLTGTTVSCALGQPAAGASVTMGTITEEQAVRGQALYYEHCLKCHGDMMQGLDKAPQLAGPQFSSVWSGSPLLALVARIGTMPPEKPGSLSRQESVDVLSYILWYNGLPLGDKPLDTEQGVLAQMVFQIP